MSRRKHFVMNGENPHQLMCGKPRARMSEATTMAIRVTCRRCLGRMMRDAESDYVRHSDAAKEARHRVAQLSAQLRSGQLVL